MSMEPSEIDWNNVVSRYELDEVYERINAPKWLDFSATDPVMDDVAWFCRSDCRHPVTYEDFHRWNPSPMSKLLKCKSEFIRADDQIHRQRDPDYKRRGKNSLIFPSPGKPKLNFGKEREEDLENCNPNIEATPLMIKDKKIAAAKKDLIKSSAGKKGGPIDEYPREIQRKMANPEPQPRLQSTFSSRNLFSGKDILRQGGMNFRKEREEVLENLNPNMETIPLMIKEKKMAATKKDSIKSSAEKKGEPIDEDPRNIQRKMANPGPQPRLKSTFSSKNLFLGRDVLSQISGFWLELKNLATRKLAVPSLEEAKEGGSDSKENEEGKKALISAMKNGTLKKPEMLGNPEKSNTMREVRASPPTPQKFPSPSARSPLKCSKISANPNFASSPSSLLCKVSMPKSPLIGRSGEKKDLLVKSVICSCSSETESSVDGDVVWFLRPCTFLRRFN